VKYDKEIKALTNERDQIKTRLDRLVQQRGQLDQAIQGLVNDYNGTQKAINKLTEMGQPKASGDKN
jgi:uncharacterized coiled-coil DUF342 family protein